MLTRSHATTMMPVTDLNRARTFYEEQLGLHARDMQPAKNEVVYETSGSTIALYERPDPPKSDHTQVSFEVPDIEREVAELRQRGVTFERYAIPGATEENGICDLGFERAAWLRDPDGNIICIHQKARR